MKDPLERGRIEIKDATVAWRPMLFGGLKIRITWLKQHQRQKMQINTPADDVTKLALWSLTPTTTREQALRTLLKAVRANYSRDDQIRQRPGSKEKGDNDAD